MEFNSPELERFERELEVALETGIREFKNELEESPHSSLDETCFSMEEDLRNAENACDGIQKLMMESTDKDDTPTSAAANAPSESTQKSINNKNDVKYLASKFEQRSISTERSLSVKQGLAMFGSTVQKRPPTATVKYDPPMTVEVKVPMVTQPTAETDLKQFSEQKPASTLLEPNRVKTMQIQASDTSTKDGCSGSIRDKYSKYHDGESMTSSLPPPPKRENPPKSSQSKAQNSNNFTPIKSKEYLATSTTSKPTTTIVDDATINERRKALVQSLKVHIGKHVEETPHIVETNDDTSNAFHSDQMNEIDIECCIESPISTSDSTSDLDTVMLQEYGVLSPINERSNEADSDRNSHQHDSCDNDSGQWELPIVSCYPKQQPSSPRSLRGIRCKCYNQTLACVIKACTLAISLFRGAMFTLSPLLWCIFNRGKSMALACITNITYFFILISNVWRQITLYIIECYEEWTMLSRLSPSGFTVLLQWIANMERGAAACLASMILSMATEVSPVAPRYNCNIAVLLWLFQVKPVESKRQSIALLVLVMLSICVDFDWISSTYTPEQLGDDQGNTIAYKIEQEESLLRAITWYGVVANLLLKLLCLNSSLRSSRRGMFVRSTIWQHINVYCTVTEPDDVNEATKAKIAAIVWLELIALASCFASFFVIDSKGGSSALWQDGPRQLLSLQATLLYKGVTGVLCFLSLFHHISLRDILPMTCCSMQDTSANRGRRRIISTLHSSKKCIVVTKMTDFSIGVVLWFNLVSAHKDFTRDAPKDSIVLYALLSATQVMSCIISPCLCAVVAWWIHSNRKKSSREKNRHSAMLGNTPASTREQRRQRSRDRRRDVKGSSDSVSSKRSSRRNTKSEHHLKSPSSIQHTSSDMEYDLANDVGTSQNLFETRLCAASPPVLQSHLSTAPSSLHELDVDVLCSPREFRSNWASLPSGTVISCKVEKPSMPSLSDCHRHFAGRGFYVIASGVVGHKTKLFVVAQRRGVQSLKARTPPKELVTRCYCEIVFDLQDKEMNAEIRCTDKSQMTFFVAALGLKDLI